MDFGWFWKGQLRELLGQQLSYREIARRLSVDPNTVIKYANQNEHDKSEEITEDTDQYKMEYRKQWIDLQKEYPLKSKTELRKMVPAVYTYLYRHDKGWLNVHSPTFQTRTPSVNRVDWKKRDREVIKEVELAVKQLLDRAKPKKITFKAISNEAGLTAFLEQNLDKMPRTKTYIESVQETDTQFRVRRVKFVIEEMKENGEEIKEWKIYRLAGVRPEYYSQIIDVINRHTNLKEYLLN